MRALVTDGIRSDFNRLVVVVPSVTERRPRRWSSGGRDKESVGLAIQLQGGLEKGIGIERIAAHKAGVGGEGSNMPLVTPESARRGEGGHDDDDPPKGYPLALQDEENTSRTDPSGNSMSFIFRQVSSRGQPDFSHGVSTLVTPPIPCGV